MSQALPASKQLNLNKLSDADGSQIQWLTTLSETDFSGCLCIHEKLREFTDSQEVYYPNKSTDNLIKMPQWEEIRGLAKDVLQAFNFHKK